MEKDNSLYAVIMAGGSGTRFWPQSRQRRPKHLLSIFGRNTILQETFARLAPLFPPERMLIVTAGNQAGEVLRQLPEMPAGNVIIEPVGRNTAPCIALAALHLEKRDEGAVMAVLPADQQITQEEEFRQALVIACETARSQESLITLGVTPTAPETGYGYIETGGLKAEVKGHQIYQTKAFREKPSLPQAREYLAGGGYLWNSGIFIWQVKAIMSALNRWLPGIYQSILEIRPALGTGEEQKAVERVYGKISSVSIDYGVMEKADNVLVIPGRFGWLDVGSWDAFFDASAKDNRQNCIQAKDAVLLNSKNCLVVSPHKLVALVGVEDLIVVETKDALLVCRRDQSQAVKSVVEELARQDKKEYL